MAKSKKFWIAHDNDPDAPYICVCTKKLRETKEYRGWDVRVMVDKLCLNDFTKLTGIKLKVGDVKAVWLVEEEPGK